MLRQRLELVNGGEHINELHHSSAKQVESAEDLSLREVELLSLGQGKKLVLSHAILLLSKA